jgi:methionyl-tRNA synthetase
MHDIASTGVASTSGADLTSRPSWPKRAIVTSGQPYGNKDLHFGHISGVFVPADFYARFLRDRIGRENVAYISATDCYGSPIMEGFRKRVENEGYEGTIEDYVRENHELQAEALAAYDISLDMFSGSALEPEAHMHNRLTKEVIERLYEQGFLKLRQTKQFYDPQAQTFLNGRQVLGHCPVEGCKSEKAYADECDLGHQFEPEELIAPVSQLTGCTPELRPVSNWYFDLPAFRDFIASEVERQGADERVRAIVPTTVSEWLMPPVIYVQEKFREQYEQVAGSLPAHTVSPVEGRPSFALTFENWEARDEAHQTLTDAGIRTRTGKTLLPFRITGNIDWGVPAPEIDGVTGLTTWCWPESLWAPISITAALLEQDQATGGKRYSSDDWRDWWCSPDAVQYQFIGQDNIYFYCVAQPAMWEALGWGLSQSLAIANYHILFMGKKASSSGAVKPPMARDLLQWYTPEQLRAHWLSLDLGSRPVSFSPKPLDPKAAGNPAAVDPVLKESALLTNVFNRLARSCFYGAASATASCIPAGKPSDEALHESEQALLDFERQMYLTNLASAMHVADDFIRAANKRWSDASKAAKTSGDDEAYLAALRDAFHELRCATLIMHPAVPRGCEKIREHFAIDADAFFSWDNAFLTLDELTEKIGETPGAHRIVELEPHYDFFEKHPSQVKQKG